MLGQGYDYTKHTVKAGAAFTFWIFGGAGAGTYRSTNLHLYRRYSEHIYITVNIHFEVLPSVTTP